MIAVVSSLALLCLAGYCLRVGGWGADPIDLERQAEHLLDFKIDINAATWMEWSQVPGIGPVLANRIVEERERNGPFRDLPDLHRVKGIGDRRIEAIQPYVFIDSTESSSFEPQGMSSDLDGSPR